MPAKRSQVGVADCGGYILRGTDLGGHAARLCHASVFVHPKGGLHSYQNWNQQSNRGGPSLGCGAPLLEPGIKVSRQGPRRSQSIRLRSVVDTSLSSMPLKLRAADATE